MRTLGAHDTLAQDPHTSEEHYDKYQRCEHCACSCECPEKWIARRADAAIAFKAGPRAPPDCVTIIVRHVFLHVVLTIKKEKVQFTTQKQKR